MRILFIQKVKALVGSEKYFLELIPELEKNGIETEFVCIYSEIDEEKTIPFIDAYKKLGLKIHVQKIKSEKSILKSIRFINKVYQNSNFDLVHSHLIHADFWSALLKKTGRIKCPLVSTKHGYDEQFISKHGFSAKELKLNRYLKLCRFSEKYIDRSFAVSKGLMDFFIEANISKPDKIDYIHHGFDLPELKGNQNSKFRESKQQLIVLGRIIPFKGHQLLIEALPFVKTEFPDFKLIIIGHGDEELITSLKSQISELDLEKNVVFKGYQFSIYDYLSNSDLMIVPSISEGFGLIFLEALNAKLPIIGFDVPATNEIILDNENGLIVPAFDTKILGESIVTLLKDEDKRIEMGSSGHNLLKEHFSMNRMLNQTIAFYQSQL